MSGDLTSRTDFTWADLLLSWEVGRAFGLVEGFELASDLVEAGVREALADTPGKRNWHDRLDPARVDLVVELFRLYLNVGRRPAGETTADALDAVRRYLDRRHSQ